MSATLIPLDQIASEVNARLAIATKRAGKKADDHRLAAGLLLSEARRRVLADGGQWEAWCHGRIDRCPSEIRRLVKAAGETGRELAPIASAALAVRKSGLSPEERRACMLELFGSPPGYEDLGPDFVRHIVQPDQRKMAEWLFKRVQTLYRALQATDLVPKGVPGQCEAHSTLLETARLTCFEFLRATGDVGNTRGEGWGSPTLPRVPDRTAGPVGRP